MGRWGPSVWRRDSGKREDTAPRARSSLGPNQKAQNPWKTFTTKQDDRVPAKPPNTVHAHLRGTGMHAGERSRKPLNSSQVLPAKSNRPIWGQPLTLGVVSPPAPLASVLAGLMAAGILVAGPPGFPEARGLSLCKSCWEGSRKRSGKGTIGTAEGEVRVTEECQKQAAKNDRRGSSAELKNKTKKTLL